MRLVPASASASARSVVTQSCPTLPAAICSSRLQLSSRDANLISLTTSEQQLACASLPQLRVNSTTLRSASLIFTTRPLSLSFSGSTATARLQCCYPYSSCCKRLQIPRIAQCRVGVRNLHEQVRASAAPRISYDHSPVRPAVTAFLTQTS